MYIDAGINIKYIYIVAGTHIKYIKYAGIHNK